MSTWPAGAKACRMMAFCCAPPTCPAEEQGFIAASRRAGERRSGAAIDGSAAGLGPVGAGPAAGGGSGCGMLELRWPAAACRLGLACTAHRSADRSLGPQSRGSAPSGPPGTRVRGCAQRRQTRIGSAGEDGTVRQWDANNNQATVEPLRSCLSIPRKQVCECLGYPQSHRAPTSNAVVEPKDLEREDFTCEARQTCQRWGYIK